MRHRADPAAGAAIDAVLADVLHGSRLGVVLLTPAGRLRWHNPMAAAVLGDDAGADLLDRPLSDFLLDSNEQRPLLALLATALDRGATDLPVPELRHRDGRRWLRVTLQPVAADRRAVAGASCAAVVMDVTDQLREREEADREGALLREAARLGRIGAWDLEVEARRVRWSDETFAIHDLPPGTVPPLDQAIEFYDEASQPLISAAVVAAMERGQPFDLELGLISATGRPKRVRAIGHAQREGGRVVRVAGLFHDVTETAAARQAIAELTERLRLATEAAGAGVWEWSAQPPQVVWDDQMYRLHGLPPGPGTLSLQQWADLLDAPDRAVVMRELGGLQAGQAGAGDRNVHVTWPDGSRRQLQLRGRVVGGAGGVPRMVGICIDVTEREQHAQALLDKAAAERANRAKSEFLSRVSHELRTPLNGVLGFAQLLQMRGDELPGWAAGPLRHIREAGDHLLALVDDMLDLGSIESGAQRLQAAPVALDAVVHEALQLVAPAARIARVSLQPWADCGRSVRADATRLRQVLLNLLGNAIKFNRVDGEVALSWQVDGDWLTLCVQDTGIGISPERQRELYQPFNRLGAEGGPVPGSGLGLAIARQLVEAMGGQLVLRSEAGRGTEATLTLPLAPPPVPAAAPGAAPGAAVLPAPVEAPAQAPCRVLYVEDNVVNGLLVREALAQQQPRHALRLADSGEQGLVLAAAELPDVVLLDLNLPGIDGYEVLARLRAEPGGARLPCIAVSADALPEEVARARAAGFDDYWTKPLVLAGLAERIAQAVAGGPASPPGAGA